MAKVGNMDTGPMVHGIFAFTWTITSLAWSTAALVAQTLQPSETYPCSSGGVTDTSTTSIEKVPLEKFLVDS